MQDTAYSPAKGSFGGAALNAIGLVPFASDALKTTRASLQYAKLAPKGAHPALRWTPQNVALRPVRRIVDNIIARLGPQRLQIDIDRRPRFGRPSPALLERYLCELGKKAFEEGFYATDRCGVLVEKRGREVRDTQHLTLAQARAGW